MKNYIIATIVGLTVLSCDINQIEQPSEAEVIKARAAYDEMSTNMVESLEYLKQPLSTLNSEQRASVAALLLMTRVAAQQQAPGEIGTAFIDQMWTEIPDYCPPLPENTLSRFGDCRDQELAYGTSMARCLEEDKTEAECEKESSGDLAAAVMCRMQEIDELSGIIGEIPGRDWPPSPIPWPVRIDVP